MTVPTPDSPHSQARRVARGAAALEVLAPIGRPLIGAVLGGLPAQG